ncbi:MAG: hypothetical protein Q8Q06_02080 [bacterium]|nr:hypothetical protein [bacterium]
MREWLKLWPVRFAVIVFILNMEFVTIPFVFKFLMGLSGTTLQKASAGFGTFELCFWYWYLGWFAVEKYKRIKHIIEAGKQELSRAKEDIAEARQSDKGKYYEERLRKEILDKWDLEKYKNSRLVVFLMGLGYLTGVPIMFVLGLMPVIWIAGLIVCRFTGWRLWFLALLVGNAIKNGYGYALGWDYVFSLF